MQAWIAVVALLAIVAVDSVAAAQTAREVFERVAPSVVVIRARGRDVTAAGLTRFTETGSGVLVTSSGQVMTAAHVVQTLDEISVEFLGGETVRARVIASEPAADLSLLQLERMPPGAAVATMADSNTVRVGDPVIVGGAPYGLSHALRRPHQRAVAGQHRLSFDTARGVLPDRCRHQHRKLGWSHVRHAGERHRDRQPQHLEERRQRGPRLRGDAQHRPAATAREEVVLVGH